MMLEAREPLPEDQSTADSGTTENLQNSTRAGIEQGEGLRLLFDGPIDIRSISLTILTILALVALLYFAKAVFLPIVLAFLLSFLLGPLVRFLEKAGIPESVGAGLILVLLLGSLGYGVFRLVGPASEWMSRLPEGAQKLEERLRVIRQPVREVSEAAEEVEKTLNEEESTPEVRVRTPTLRDSIFSQTPDFFIGLSATLILLYFLLAFGDLFLRKLVRVMPRFKDKRSAVEIIRRIEDHISYYLLTVTLVNIGLGICVGLGMALIGMPNPILWGVAATVLNFIPYVGAITGSLLVLLVAAVTFDSLEMMLLAPGIYLAITSLEGSFITPLILGQRLTLNPVVIFVSLITWGWLWGIVGTLIAVPMLVCLKILCDHIEPLQPLGEFLGW